MQKIRILHLRKSEGFYGAEKVIILLSKGVKKYNYTPVVGCLYDLRQPVGDLIVAAQENGIVAEKIICKSRLDFKALRQIISLIKKRKIDIIHSHGFKADIYGWLATRWTHVPIIATKHGWTSSNSIVCLWEWIDMFFLRFFDQVVAVSEEVRYKLLRKIPEQCVKLIPNGITVKSTVSQNVVSLRTKLGLEKTNQVVGIVGRLSIEKGHKFFLDAAKQIVEKIPSTRFLIVGEGSLRNKLEEYTNLLNLKNVVFFTGYRNDIREIYSLLDVIVSASLREGLPLTLLEAMAMEKPVVATRVGEINNLIQDKINGFLVSPEDSNSIARSVITLLKDKKLRTKIGKEARKTIQKKYSSEKMVEAYTLLYRQFSGNKLL